jgi:hypothetical protein
MRQRVWNCSLFQNRKTVARPERFELPTTWFEGPLSIIHKSLIFNSIHQSSCLIFPQDITT